MVVDPTSLVREVVKMGELPTFSHNHTRPKIQLFFFITIFHVSTRKQKQINFKLRSLSGLPAITSQNNIHKPVTVTLDQGN